MNTRIVLSATLATGVFFASAPMQAQAPALSSAQKLQAKIAAQQAQVYALQAQVNALQAQVKRLQAQVRASSPSGVVGPNYQIPNIQIPNYNIVPFQNPGIQDYQFPGTQGQQPQILVPRTYSNIPPCSIILIQQKTH